jgi:RHS repeat-associated protein
MVMQSVDEERLEHGSAGVRRVVRTYPTVPGALVPFAQRETSDGQVGPVEHVLAGPTGLPTAIARGDGRAIRALEGDLYGAMPAGQAGATAARFVGQWYDEEAGLHSNWHRYYDPETGGYLSAEPLGLVGSLKAYAYTNDYPLGTTAPSFATRPTGTGEKPRLRARQDSPRWGHSHGHEGQAVSRL